MAASADPVAEAEAKTTAVAVVRQDDRPPPKPSPLATAKSLDDVPLVDAAKALMASGLVRNGEDAGKLMTKLDLGRSLGLPTVTSVNGIHFMTNGIVMSAAVMRLLINRWASKYKVVIKQRDLKGCAIEAFVKEGGDWVSMGVPVTFGPDDAKRAGLDAKDTYRKWPVDMYYNRALAATFRTYMPDCAGGNAVYLPEEIPDSGFRTDPATGDMVADAEYEAKPRAAKKAAAAAPAEPVVDRVRRLIEDTKTDTAKFLAFYKKAKVEDLTDKELASAEDLLKKKARATP